MSLASLVLSREVDHFVSDISSISTALSLRVSSASKWCILSILQDIIEQESWLVNEFTDLIQDQAQIDSLDSEINMKYFSSDHQATRNIFSLGMRRGSQW